MLDAVRLCGRWISKAILQRITARTLGPEPPPRQELLQEFCRRTDWRNRKGELWLSSANVLHLGKMLPAAFGRGWSLVRGG